MKIRKDILILSVSFIAVVLSLVFCLKKIFFKPEEEAVAKVAIVVDDWGYNLHHLNFLKQIDVPLTISILPNLRYSSKIAKIVQAQGREVILHLPLEPEKKDRKIGLEEHTISSNMSDDEIVGNLELAISSVPYISGVSNHMGSRATKDNRLMSVIFAELKKRRLFFLDNLVTDKSICRKLAKKMQIKFASRDIFLDNSDNNEYIRGQFKKLTELAQKFGQAVGVGHGRLKTLQILKDEVASMQSKGIKFVFVSDLVE